MELKEKSPESFWPLTILYSFEPLLPKRTTAHQQCHPKRSRTNDNDEKKTHTHTDQCVQKKESETGSESKHMEKARQSTMCCKNNRSGSQNDLSSSFCVTML